MAISGSKFPFLLYFHMNLISRICDVLDWGNKAIATVVASGCTIKKLKTREKKVQPTAYWAKSYAGDRHQKKMQTKCIPATTKASLRATAVTLRDVDLYFNYVISNQFARNFPIAIICRKPTLARKTYFLSCLWVLNRYLFFFSRKSKNSLILRNYFHIIVVNNSMVAVVFIA